MLDFVLDLLFPKRCVGCKKVGSYLCSNCMAHIEMCQNFICPICLRQSKMGETHQSCIKDGLDGLSVGVVYKGVVRRLLFSFREGPRLSNLRLIIGKLFIETISQNELFLSTLSSRPIVINMPLSSGELKKRGYNQSEILAQALCREFHLKLYANVLQKTNNQKVFMINKKYAKMFHKQTVLLVDDYARDLSELNAYAGLLKEYGAKAVYGVLFAR